MYAYTDQEGWPVYQYFYQNGQGITLWLHFYDEGLFYDGFYVINTSEVWGKRMHTKTKYVSHAKYFSQSGYEEVDGSVFIYNSDSDDCPDDTGHNWYYWQTNRWIYDESFYLVQC